MNKDQEPCKPVSIDDLLKVKKAERPAPEFWGEWQRSTRAKLRDVAAVRRPWWKDALPRLGITVARWHVAVGATALATLVIVAVEEYQPALRSLPEAAAAVPASDVFVASVKEAHAPAETVRVASSETAVDVPSSVRSQRDYAPGELSGAVAMILTPDRVASTVDSSAKLAGSLHTLGLRQPLGTTVAFASVRDSADRSTKPKDRSEARHLRYLSYSYNPTIGFDSSDDARISDQAPGRINEEELYETASSRIGARGDRVSLRF